MQSEYFEALYTSMLYRKKKVKKFKEGFIKRIDQKLVLYDDKKLKIESIFNSNKLEEGLELEFDENYCEVGQKENERALGTVEPVSSSLNVKAPVKRMGLSRSSGLKVTMKRKDDLHANISHVDLVQSNGSQSSITIPRTQPPQIVSTRKLKLDDVRGNTVTDDQKRDVTRNIAPKSNQELLDLFMSEEPVQIQEQENALEPPRSIGSCFTTPVTPLSTSIVPTFKEFNGSGSSSGEDYEETRAPIGTTSKSTPEELQSRPTVSPKINNGQKRFTPVLKASLLNPSKKFKAPVLKTRNFTVRPNKFNFCFQAPLKDQGNKLFREMSIPNTFKDITQYKSCLSGCLTETINLELQSLRLKFEKVLQKSKQKLDSAMRYQRIPFYSNVCLSQSQCLDFGNGSRSNVCLVIENKEHHSQYSKDDIWIVSDTPDMIDCE